MKIFFACPVSLFNTPQEKRDIETLKALGFEVVSPNTPEGNEGYKAEGLEYFNKLVDECDAVAFRAFVDLKVGSGIVSQVERAMLAGKPVIELPTLTNSRVLDRGETTQYLKFLGQR